MYTSLSGIPKAFRLPRGRGIRGEDLEGVW